MTEYDKLILVKNLFENYFSYFSVTNLSDVYKSKKVNCELQLGLNSLFILTAIDNPYIHPFISHQG